jgi:hypothetical protein
MLFISIRSGDAEFVPKVLQVVHETTRLRHIAGASTPLTLSLSFTDALLQL